MPLIKQVTDTLYHVVKMISSAPTDLVISAKLAKVAINVLIAWMNVFIRLLSMVTYIHMLSCEKFYLKVRVAQSLIFQFKHILLFNNKQ